MKSIFDKIRITIKLISLQDNPIAIATWNLNNELEIRFAPFLKKRDGSIFFTMPSLYKFGKGKAAVVLNEEKYAELKEKTWKKLLEVAKEKLSQNEFKTILKSYNKNFEKSEEVKLNEIPF